MTIAAPEVYCKYVLVENGKAVWNMIFKRFYIYASEVQSFSTGDYYQTWKLVFVVRPCNPLITNRMVVRQIFAIVCHIYDLNFPTRTWKNSQSIKLHE